MATRGQVKTWIRTWLGTGEDDALYGNQSPGISPVLDPAVQSVVDQLIDEIHVTNPGYLSASASLAAASADSHLYALAAQTVPIIDFGGWLEVRLTDENGALLEEAPLEELAAAGSGFFCVTGPDEAAVIQTSPATGAGVPLWMRYRTWFADLENDDSVIPGIPKRFHDVVAFEALFVFGVGGESRWPDELRERRKDRHARLIDRIARRGIAPLRTRLGGDAGREG